MVKTVEIKEDGQSSWHVRSQSELRLSCQSVHKQTKSITYTHNPLFEQPSNALGPVCSPVQFALHTRPAMDPTLTPGDHTPFPHQIAGHPGVMSDPSGGLLIKPALPREIAFYQMLSNSDPEDIVWPLRKFVPKNYGTLRLEGRLGAGGAIETDLDMKNETPEVCMCVLIRGLTGRKRCRLWADHISFTWDRAWY